MHEQRLERLDKSTVVHHSHKTLSLMPQAAKAVRQKNVPLLVLEEVRGNRKLINVSEMGKSVVNALSVDFFQVRQDFILYRVAPIVLLFMWFASLLPAGWKKVLGVPLPAHEAEMVMNLAQRLIRVLRWKLKRRIFKNAEANFRKSAIDNFNNYFDAIERVADSHVEVVSIRFDLYYRGLNSAPARLDEAASTASLDDFLALCEKFQNYMRAHFGEDLLHFAWAFEHGRETAFHKHYHLTLRVPGNEDHVGIVDVLSWQWEKMTQGLGYTHNCNRYRLSYPFQALGVVRLDDPEVIEGLRRIVPYFTLAGLFVKLHVPQRRQRIRAFQQSKLTKSKRVRSGRPPRLAPGWRGRTTAAKAEEDMRFI